MKNTLLKITGFFALAVLLVSFTNSPKINSLKIGKKAPMTNYEMKNVSGEDYSLEKLAFDNGILVVFSCNSCPFVVGNKEMEGWQGRYNEIHDLCKRNKIGMALVNSNEAKRTGADSFTEMQKHSQNQKYDAAYLLDVNSKLADAFGASTTPHVFLLDSDFKLIYKGAIDNSVKSKSSVTENWLKDAIISSGKKEPILLPETRNSGCSIKRL
jgi:peroxiredoxin